MIYCIYVWIMTFSEFRAHPKNLFHQRWSSDSEGSVWYVPLLIFSNSLISYLILLLVEIVLWKATKYYFRRKYYCVVYHSTREYEKQYHFALDTFDTSMKSMTMVAHLRGVWTSPSTILYTILEPTLAATPRSTWSHSDGALYLAHQLRPFGW